MPKKIRKIFLIILFPIIFFGIIAVFGVVFIKINTPLAAQITDKYLRPILGNNLVISMEKVFYNTSDKIAQLTNRSSSFQFLNGKDGENISGGNLDLTPIPVTYFKAQKDEGIWKNYKFSTIPDKEVMAYTFVRPDSKRSFAFVTLIQLDMKELKIAAVAGKEQPSGVIGIPGPGKIPSEIAGSNRLIAAFNGGFQYKDGAYGMIVNNKTYLPLKNDLASLISYSNGDLKLIKYEGSIPAGNVDFIRQNCPMLLENGEIVTYSDANRQLWGRTPTSSIYTWRSGVGITSNGNLIYAVGNNLIPDTLAQALKMGGAVNAMQLDINPFWVRFNTFDTKGDGTYNTSTLTKGVYDGSAQFLSGYQKDFLYVYKR
ncbi:phosphodiester glycosidase family protein [Candidatus Woesebacteria bacterium]|nr:phosphodiester glycosidase family protein [Candidatus Woesebacteria bacterium]QQG47207.1 MAG: phosphodiester glycosidase family protein [Candidatus Woesebacteria bacterium]